MLLTVWSHALSLLIIDGYSFLFTERVRMSWLLTAAQALAVAPSSGKPYLPVMFYSATPLHCAV